MVLVNEIWHSKHRLLWIHEAIYIEDSVLKYHPSKSNNFSREYPKAVTEKEVFLSGPLETGVAITTIVIVMGTPTPSGHSVSVQLLKMALSPGTPRPVHLLWPLLIVQVHLESVRSSLPTFIIPVPLPTLGLPHPPP